MRKLLVILLLLFIFTSIVHAAPQTEVLVEIYPAPIGYIMYLNKPHPTIIRGYRDTTGNFVPYRADLSNSDTLFVPYYAYGITTLISESATANVKIVKSVNSLSGYKIVSDTVSMVVFSGSELYISNYEIYLDSEPYKTYDWLTRQRVLILRTGTLNVRDILNEYKVGLVIDTQESNVNLIDENGVSRTVKLTDILGVPSGCFVQFDSDTVRAFGWIGGIAQTPTCTENIKPIKTYVYKDNPYAVVFSANTRYGRIDYVIMKYVTVSTLLDLNILSRAEYGRALHITLDVDPNLEYVYTGVPQSKLLVMLQKVYAKDITTVTRSGENTRYLCPISQNAELIYSLTWRPINTSSSSIEMMPGEVLLFKTGGQNQTYLCHGDLSWIKNYGSPVVKGSGFVELKYPVQILSLNNFPVLVIMSNGKVYLSTNVLIDYDEFSKNTVFVYSNGMLITATVTQTSIFTSPFFILGLLLIVLFVGVVYTNIKPSKRREKIKIILNFPKPTPMSLASSEAVKEVSKKHIILFGVCPDILDIVIYHNILPPIPDDVSATDNVIICPFNTNAKTEETLRKLAKVLNGVLWGISRERKSSGYIYTILGNSLMYMYFYKHEGEVVEEAIVNAVKEAMKVKVQTPYYLMPLGILIVTTDDNYRRFKEEINFMKLITRNNPDVKGFDIATYITARKIVLKGNITPKEMQNFINEKVPEILVVSESTIPELLEYLEEKLVGYAELYYKLQRHGD